MKSDAPEVLLKRAWWWSAAAFGIAVLLWLAGFAGLGVPFPVAFVFLFAVWMVFTVWYSRSAFFAGLPWFALVLAIGAGLAAPWAVAVVQRMPWSELQSLLTDQVAERTYEATAINSGSPFYYLYMLPVILAPWGLLFPLHFSRGAWSSSSVFYRFCLVMCWISVLAFSFIAGKENKYVLPAAPFFLYPIGCQLAAYTAGGGEGRIWAGLQIWRRGVFALLLIGAVGLVVWVCLEEFHPVLLAECILVGLAALAVLLLPWRTRANSPLTRATLALFLVVTSGLLTRSFHYTGERSPRQIGLLCGQLLESGCTLEATEVSPPIAFYAGRRIPENRDLAAVQARMADARPYFYLTREKLIKALNVSFPPGVEIIVQPSTKKGFMILGNGSLDTACQSN